MLYAQNIFLHDVGKKTWSEAKKGINWRISTNIRPCSENNGETEWY